MRICFLANTDWYLYNFRQDLAHALRLAGHDVVLIAPRGEFAHRLVDANYPFVDIKMSRRGVNPVAELATVRSLERIYRDLKPDLVHHFTLKAVTHGSLAAERAGINAVVNAVAGLGYTFSARGLRARSVRRVLTPILRRALTGTEVIFQNPDDEAELRASGVLDAANTHLIRGSGVDVSRFEPTPEPSGEPLVVMAARHDDKGLTRRLRRAGCSGGKALRCLWMLPSACATTCLWRVLRSWDQRILAIRARSRSHR